jgi:O-antigen/teichoic acid export membrane protein
LSASLVVPIILARLLSPNEFGLIAMAAVFTNITLLITDLGTGDALIQHQKADNVLESSIFWLNIAIATSVAGVLVIASTTIGEFYGKPVIASIVQYLSLVLLIQSTTLVQLALLKKHRNFKIITLAELGSQLIGALVAVSLALNDFGIWSLVYYSIVKAFVYTVIVWVLSDWRPRFCFNTTKVRTIVSFSLNLTVVKFLNYVERNSDKLIIGYWQGESAVGLYSRAYSSFNQVIKVMNGFYNPVFYSILSKEQKKRHYIKQILLVSYQSLVYIFLPISIVLMIYSSELVLIVFGPKWLEMAPILELLGAVCIVKPIHKLNVEVFKSVNKVESLRTIWLIFTPIFVVSFLIGNNVYGSVGVATAYLVVSSLLAFVTTSMVMHYLDIKFIEIIHSFLNVILRGIAVFILAIVLNNSTIFSILNGYPELIVGLKVFFILAIYFILQLFFPVKAQQKIIELVRRRV